MRKHRRQLDPSVGASGPHDFAVRARLRQRLRRVWCQSAEALAKADQRRSSGVAAASIASRPNVRDDAYAPLSGAGWGIDKAVSTKSRSEIFFAQGLDSKFAKLPVGQISCRHCEEPTGLANARPTTGSATRPSIFLSDGKLKNRKFARRTSSYPKGLSQT